MLAGLLAGCTTTVRGVATPPSPAASTSAAAPTSAAGPSNSPAGQGAVLEAHRLASVTSLIPVTFPERTGSCPRASGPFVDAGELEDAYFDYGTADILDRHGFVAAWSECNRVTGAARATFSAIVELSDEAAVEQAAEELAAANAANGFVRVSVPGFDSPAVAQEDQASQYVLAFVPVGPVLAICYHTSLRDQGIAEISRLMTDQVALLRSFRPTAPADRPQLPTDPQDLARLVLEPPGEPTPLTGPYDLEGALRLATDPIAERELLTANNLSGYYLRQGRRDDVFATVRLWSFPNQAAAEAVHGGLVQLDETAGDRSFTSTTVPEAVCYAVRSGTSDVLRCRIQALEYLAAVSVNDPDRASATATMDELLRDQLDLIDG